MIATPKLLSAGVAFNAYWFGVHAFRELDAQALDPVRHQLLGDGRRRSLARFIAVNGGAARWAGTENRRFDASSNLQ